MRQINDIERVCQEYDLYLMMEKGMADNTRESYRRDVDKLLGYLAAEGVGLRDVTIETLRMFLGDLHDVGIAERSQARIVAGVRSFFHFMVMEGYLDANSSELLETPRIGVHLPEVLTVQEIDDMIAAVALPSMQLALV